MGRVQIVTSSVESGVSETGQIAGGLNFDSVVWHDNFTCMKLMITDTR